MNRLLWGGFAGLIFGLSTLLFVLIAFQKLPLGRAGGVIVLWHYIAPLAAFLTASFFWWLFISTASSITPGKGIWVGALIGLVSHLTSAYLALLFSSFSIPSGAPGEHMLRSPQALWFGLLSSLKSIYIVGWLTVPGGGFIGSIVAHLQSRTLSGGDERKGVINNKKALMVFIGTVLLLTVCVLVCRHDDGPYLGKVISTGTSKPVEGAVVAADWTIKMIANLEMLCDLRETVTDKNGEFELPRGWCMNHPFAEISKPRVVVFRPGYLGYPPLGGDQEERRSYMPNWGVERFFEDTRHYNVIELGIPNTRQERILTVDRAERFFIHEEARVKLPMLSKLIKEEEKTLGFNVRRK